MPRRELIDDVVIFDKGEASLRVTDRLQMQLMLDVAAFGILRAQKFAPRR
jgi:hypothetical protein